MGWLDEIRSRNQPRQTAWNSPYSGEPDPVLKDPWLDITAAMSGGAGFAGKMAYGVGRGVIGSMARGAITGGLSDIPVGAATEAVAGDASDEMGFLVNLAVGIVSAGTIEKIPRAAIEKGKQIAMKYARSSPLAKDILGVLGNESGEAVLRQGKPPIKINQEADEAGGVTYAAYKELEGGGTGDYLGKADLWDQGDGSYKIEDVFIEPEYQRQGIGTALVEQARKDYGADKVTFGMPVSEGGEALARKFSGQVGDAPPYSVEKFKKAPPRKISEEAIRQANAAGMKHADSEDYWSFHTPVLQRAYDLGRKGTDLSDAPIVRGIRYGAAPDSGLSTNFQTGGTEAGLSLAQESGKKEIGSSVWFADRDAYEYEGIRVGTGSDGETLILPLNVENADDFGPPVSAATDKRASGWLDEVKGRAKGGN